MSYARWKRINPRTVLIATTQALVEDFQHLRESFACDNPSDQPHSQLCLLLSSTPLGTASAYLYSNTYTTPNTSHHHHPTPNTTPKHQNDHHHNNNHRPLTPHPRPNPLTLTRWYIDTRPLTTTNATTNPTTPNLPLITTLQPEDQTSIRRFHHLKDKHMSLASNLLKYLFIHRSCRIPWDRITLSRTPAPHRRPCFIPSDALLTTNTKIPTIEFNVSHQASLVALAGTIIPDPADFESTPPAIPQVGIDITCTNERQPSSSSTASNNAHPRATFTNYVDIFAEVFSPEEIRLIKTSTSTNTNNTTHGSAAADAALEYSYRVFYAYWALKEAYIKMTGEALLAPWLRELEFGAVVAPEPVSQEAKVGEPYTGVRTTLHQTPVEEVRVEIVAFEKDYLIATAARGAGIGARREGADATGQQDAWEALREIDIERDVRPCAEGRCRCLE